MQTEAVYLINGNIYLYIQESSSEPGWDYTLYDNQLNDMDGGQLDCPELSVCEAKDEIICWHDINAQSVEQVSLDTFELLLDMADER